MKKNNAGCQCCGHGKRNIASYVVGVMGVGGVVLFGMAALSNRPPKPAAAAVIPRGTPINSAAPDAPPQTSGLGAAKTDVATNAQPVQTTGEATEKDYMEIGFEKLADFPTRWVCQTTNSITLQWIPRLVNPIPENITALNGKNVAVRGFMVPMKVNDGLVTEFVLARNQTMCCYGKPMQINEWLYVHMDGKGVKALMDRPITVCGTLGTGVYLQDGAVGLYRLDGKKVERPGGS